MSCSNIYRSQYNSKTGLMPQIPLPMATHIRHTKSRTCNSCQIPQLRRCGISWTDRVLNIVWPYPCTVDNMLSVQAKLIPVTFAVSQTALYALREIVARRWLSFPSILLSAVRTSKFFSLIRWNMLLEFDISKWHAFTIIGKCGSHVQFLCMKFEMDFHVCLGSIF